MTFNLFIITAIKQAIKPKLQKKTFSIKNEVNVILKALNYKLIKIFEEV